MVRLIGWQSPIPEGYFRMLTASSLQAPVLDAPVYDAPDTVVLDWSDLSNIEDGVHVYASYSEIDINALPPPVATLAPNTVQYGYAFDAGEPLEERLYFRVAAFKSGIVKASNEVSIGNPANVLYPDSPTWLFGDEEAGFANTLGLDTLFTDTSGTTPVSAYGDAIALAANLADDGPDMVQDDSGDEPIYGRMPVVGVRNLLRNNTMAGVQTGSPGVLPPGCAQSNPQGATRTILGDGVTVVDGQPVYYMDVNFAGTPTTTDAQNFYFGTGAGAAGTTGETYTVSMYVALVDGDLTNAGAFMLRYGFEAGGQLFTPDSTLRRITNTRTATATNNFCTLRWNYQDTVTPVNFTLRIGLPQMEVGSEATAPQIIDGERYNITEFGIPSVNIAYSDGTRAFKWDMAADDYYFFIAGEKGYVFGSTTHAGGDFVIGPDEWPDGPEDGIPDYIGSRYVLPPVVRNTPFTPNERALLIANAVARGTPQTNLPSEINVFLVGGQSNTDGRVQSNAGGTPSYLTDNLVDGVQVWNGSSIVPYSLTNIGQSGNGSSWVQSQSSSRWSYAHVALKLIADQLPNVVACQVTSGGTRFYPVSNTRGCWNADYGSIPGGTPALLEALVNRCLALKDYCDMLGITFNLRGLIWHQGESDGDETGYADAYADNWAAFVAKLRTDIDAPDLPIYHGTVPALSTAYNSTVRAAMLDFASNDGHVYCRDNDDVSLQSDDLHFDAAGSVLFGTDVAAAVLSDLGL